MAASHQMYEWKINNASLLKGKLNSRIDSKPFYLKGIPCAMYLAPHSTSGLTVGLYTLLDQAKLENGLSVIISGWEKKTNESLSLEPGAPIEYDFALKSSDLDIEAGDCWVVRVVLF